MKRKGWRIGIGWLAIGMILARMASPAMARELTLLEGPGHLLGYVTQEGSIGLADPGRYDTVQGLQSALMNLFLEGDYQIGPQWRLYASGKWTVDSAYQLNAHRDSWNDRLFSRSRDRLNVDHRYWQVLNEAHLTWTPGSFSFRLGKQIVAWGETDGFRLMDQINPLDQRRGFADVEFENTLIPIWLLRVLYAPGLHSRLVQDPGLELVFNPNATFIPNQSIQPGNDVGGIWAPDISFPGPFPGGAAHLGSAHQRIQQPGHFDPHGFEYGFRVKGVVKEALITLNSFYGRDNDPVMWNAGPPRLGVASDRRWILHPSLEGRFPLFRFVGATLSRDLPFLKSSVLGGVAPVVRFETLYAFRSTFATTINTLNQSDEWRGALGVDWKIKIPLLNPRAYFPISAQFYHRKILDYPSSYRLANLKENNDLATLFIRTSYFNARLAPSFFWLHDISNQADFFKSELAYDYTHNWRFTLGSLFLHGERKGQGFEVFDNKDQVYFKISYRWS